MKKYLSFLFIITLMIAHTYAADEPAIWARDEVSDAIGFKMVDTSLQKDYQQNISRQNFAMLANGYIGSQYGYDMQDSKGVFFSEFLDYYRKSDGSKFSKEQYTKPLHPSSFYSWRYILSNFITEFYDLSPIENRVDEINLSYLLGIVKGQEKGVFNPDTFITRQEAATIILRAYSVIDPNCEFKDTPLTYTDANSIADWAKKGIGFCQSLNIIHGDENGAFSPNCYLTVEQAILLFSRLNRNAPLSKVKGNIPALKTADKTLELLLERTDLLEILFLDETHSYKLIYILCGEDGILDTANNLYVLYFIYPDGDYICIYDGSIPLKEYSYDEANQCFSYTIEYEDGEIRKIDKKV